MPIILSGLTVRDALLPQLAKRVEHLGRLSHTPKLVIIQVGDRSDSTAYITAKKSFAAKVGIMTELVILPADISQEEVQEQIRRSNEDTTTDGIIVQLPLPEHIDRRVVIETIDPRKDVDGLTQVNQRKLETGDSTGIMPATARGIQELLRFYHIDLAGKRVTVVGRSSLVGHPVALMSQHAGAEVTVCHRGTTPLDLVTATRRADVLIVAAGKPGLITVEHVRTGQTVIDVGINRLPDGSLSGDVDFEKVKDVVTAITPVPGGVGPMTVCMLLSNVVDATERL